MLGLIAAMFGAVAATTGFLYVSHGSDAGAKPASNGVTIRIIGTPIIRQGDVTRCFPRCGGRSAKP
jgi:hypothetical protein